MRVYLGFSVLWICHFGIVLVLFLLLQTDVKWRKEATIKKKNAVYSWPKVEHSEREEGGSTWFLKLPEAPSQNSAQLVDAKSKRHPLMVRDDQLLFMILW